MKELSLEANGRGFVGARKGAGWLININSGFITSPVVNSGYHSGDFTISGYPVVNSGYYDSGGYHSG